MQSEYVVEIELDRTFPEVGGEELVDDVMDALRSDHVVVATSPVPPRNIVIVMTLEASSALEATAVGVAKVEPFGPVLGFTVTPEDLRNFREGFDFPVEGAVTVAEAASMAGVSRQAIYKWIDQDLVTCRRPTEGYGLAIDRMSLMAHVAKRATSPR